MVSLTVICWSLTLSVHNYEISYRPGKQQTDADALSQLPLLKSPLHVPETVLLLNQLSCSLTSVADKKLWTAKAQPLNKFCELL